MKRRRNDTAEKEPGNRRRVKGRGSERIHAKGAKTEGAHGTHGLHGRAEAEESVAARMACTVSRKMPEL